MREEIDQKPHKSFPSPYKVECVLYLQTDINLLPTVTTITQQLFEDWFSVLCPSCLEMRHEALRRETDTDVV